MITQAQCLKIVRQAIQDVRLVVHRPSGTDLTDTVHSHIRLIEMVADEYLDGLVPSKRSAGVEDALLHGICRIAALHDGLHHAKQMIEVGVAPDLDVFRLTVKPEDFEIVW